MLLSHRLFFALVPPRIERARIGLIRDQIGPVDCGVGNDRLHVTLAISADHPNFPTDVVDRMLRIGEDVSADPFWLSLDRLSGGGQSVALRPSKRSGALYDVQRQLAQAMDYWAIAREGWSFSPHVTIAYRVGDPFIRPIAPIGWEAGEIALIHSVVGETRHVTLGRWPLISDQFSFGEF